MNDGHLLGAASEKNFTEKGTVRGRRMRGGGGCAGADYNLVKTFRHIEEIWTCVRLCVIEWMPVIFITYFPTSQIYLSCITEIVGLSLYGEKTRMTSTSHDLIVWPLLPEINWGNCILRENNKKRFHFDPKLIIWAVICMIALISVVWLWFRAFIAGNSPFASTVSGVRDVSNCGQNCAFPVYFCLFVVFFTKAETLITHTHFKFMKKSFL